MTATHFEDMRDRIIMATLHTMAIHEDERHRLAVHESGHTAVAYFLPNTDPIHKVTIIPRGRSLGGTRLLPELEHHALPEDYLRDRLAVMLGGGRGEKTFLGTLSPGADEDIRIATELARRMVGRWACRRRSARSTCGRAKNILSLVARSPNRGIFWEETAKIADAAVKRLLSAADARAHDVLDKHRLQVERLVAALTAEETLDRSAVAALLRPRAVGYGGRARPGFGGGDAKTG